MLLRYKESSVEDHLVNFSVFDRSHKSNVFSNYFCIVRTLAAIILLVVFSAQQSSRLLVWLDYTMNQPYIAANLCENKAKPQLRCKGKCYLKKQLAKAETPDATSGHEKSGRDFQEVIYSNTAIPFAFVTWIQSASLDECTPTLPTDILSAGYAELPMQPPKA
jgi:hypothetical protein